MDIYCGKCGEPWDMDTFHDVALDEGTTWNRVAAKFRQIGCNALSGTQCNPNGDVTRATVASALMDVLGDDMDGLAAMMADYDYMTG
jgi:hypothetical protein